MGRRTKKATTVYDKVKELDPSFIEEVYTLTTEALKDRVVTLNKHAVEIQEAKIVDTDLASKEEAAREARKTYSEPLNANRLKRRLIIQILNERGEKALAVGDAK